MGSASLDLVSDPAKKEATYQDVLDAPEDKLAEIIDGELRVTPRPAAPHASASSRLGGVLTPPFDFGAGGPGGWMILDEPELHFGRQILVPDLGGWRTERLGETVPDAAYFTLPPDWVCELLSRSTTAFDRNDKLPIYARAGVGHVWLIDARWRTLEILRLHEGKWLIVGLHRGDVRVRAEPFDAIEIDLSIIWARLPPPPNRAAEIAAEYAQSPIE